MINRNSYQDIVQSFFKILSHYDNEEFEHMKLRIANTRDRFDIKLLVIGHYNAGKSSLLNGLLGRGEFLKEAQRRETALATELRFSEQESAHAYTNTGEEEVLDREKTYTIHDYSHLAYDLPSQSLKEVSDFTIVDTPGFDAGLEAHAKALAEYIGRGSAYLVVIDQAQGGIQSSTMDVIREISEYSHQIAILINKCDKITETTAEEIKNAAELSLECEGYSYPVFTVSKFDPDIMSRMVTIISGFNGQKAFDGAMAKRLSTEFTSARTILELSKKKLYLNTFDIDTEILKLKQLQKDLLETVEKQGKMGRDSISNKAEEILNIIRGRLLSKKDQIVDALIDRNQDGAAAIMVEVIRPVMLSSLRESNEEQIAKIVASMASVQTEDRAERELLTQETINLAENLKDLINSGSFEMPDTKEQPNGNKYRAITGAAALLTDFIAPWLEIVIILLPDIINLLCNVFGESVHDRAGKQFQECVIPQICNKMYPQIETALRTNLNTILNEFETKMSDKMEAVQQTLQEATNRKQQQVSDYETYAAQLEMDLEELKELSKKVR